MRPRKHGFGFLEEASMFLHRMRQALSVFAIVTSGTLAAIPAFAQQGQSAETARIAITGAIDFRNVYMFRGIREDDTGVIAWPYADLGLGLHSGDGRLKNVSLHVGTTNSLNSGVAGSDGLSGKRWYESDVYTTLALGFDNGFTVGTTFTAYRSPNDMFTTVKEVSVKAAVDRGVRQIGLKPYGLVAFELDAKPGIGQLDGGFKAGKYLELGVAPRYASRHIALDVPVKVGLSLGNYYELAGTDHRFGFVSVAGIVTLPFATSTKAGSWNVHGGVEYQRLGTTTKAFNNGDATKTIASVGIGFSR
jgi:hypothetical protein